MEDDSNHLSARRGKERHHPVARAIALSLIAVFFLAITLLSVSAAASSPTLSVQAPMSVTEGQAITVSVSGPGTLTILRDGDVINSGASTIEDTLLTNSSSAGVYNYTFETDTSGVASETRIIEVMDVPLIVTPTQPASNDITMQDVTFALTTNWEPDLCYVNIDGVSHTLSPTGQEQFSGTFALDDGVHAIEYKCKLGTEIASAKKTIRVDTTPPKVTGTAPTGDVNGPHVTIAVDTDEIAQCRIGTADAPFDGLPTLMSTTYALRSTLVQDIEAEGAVTYFVRCQDVVGNKMLSSAIISFTNRLPPSARILLDAKQPLRAGTYPLTVETSVPLSSPPILSYTVQESGKTAGITLDGQDSTWHGYLVVPEELPYSVAAFSFSGTSVRGVAGTTVTEGALVTIDSLPPPPVDTITVTNTSDGIELRWYTVNAEENVSYNIYRSSHEGVTYADLYTAVSSTTYTDPVVNDARYYYYRIAPVDRAGNVGPLSMEVYGSAVDAQLQEQPTVVIDPALAARIDDELASIASALIDANSTVQSLEQNSNPAEIAIINDMGLVEKGRGGMFKIKQAVSQLQTLRQQSPTLLQVASGIAQARSLVAQARPMLIRRITPVQALELKQPADADALKRNLPYATIGHTMNESEANAYLARAVTLNDGVTVTVSASVFRLFDAAGSDLEYTFVRKRIALQDPANDVIAVEVIPKGVAQAASELTFSKEPTILENDPVIQYSYPILQQEEYSYVLQRAASLDDVRASRTLLYPKPSAVAPAAVSPASGADDSGALGTGYATRVGLSFLPSSTSDMVLVVLGVVVIIALGVYYFSLSSPPFKGIPGVRPQPPISSPRMSGQLRSPARIVPYVGAGRRVRSAGTTIRQAQASQSVAQQVRDAAPALSSVSTRELLLTAERTIDAKNYDVALSAYKTVLQQLERDEGLAQMLQDDVLRVYAKLLLFKSLSEAKHCVEAKDIAALRAALDEARQYATVVGEAPTSLVQDAKGLYAEFVQELNRLEISRGERY
jgi:hypothetical protein